MQLFCRSLLITSLCSALPVTFHRQTRQADTDVDQLQSVANVVDNWEASRTHSQLPTLSATHQHSQQHQRHSKRRIREALSYLANFGYLRNAKASGKTLTKAIREFQEIAGVPLSGVLDRDTLRHMHMPRCGNPDVLTNQERRRMKRFAQVSKWSNKLDTDDTLRLKWFIQKFTKDISKENIRSVVNKAFKLWSDQVPIPSIRTLKLDFAEAKRLGDADINILWAEGNHGDDYPFDGAGNTTNILAHTFYPNYQETGTLNGDIHFDDHERWVLDNVTDVKGVHFPYVLVHEIGHALGLGHSKRQEAVMNPIYKQLALENVVLDIDDKCAVNWNYIGPSNTCLFVWLMVELLPRAKETNTTAHGINAIRSDANEEQNSPEQLNIDSQITNTLQSIREDEIPECSDGNTVQTRFQYLLEQKLDFTTDSARAYGPVICNFFRGLSNVVRRQHELGEDLSRQLSQVGITFDQLLGVRTVPTDEQLFVDRLKRSLEPPISLEYHKKSTIFDRDYFDEFFFKNLLKMLYSQQNNKVGSSQ